MAVEYIETEKNYDKLTIKDVVFTGGPYTRKQWNNDLYNNENGQRLSPYIYGNLGQELQLVHYH